MAATDYLTMQRVKTLKYSIPEQCDADAASLIRALLVGYPELKCLMHNESFVQVLDPTERLGLVPNSSAQELRQHSFFVGDNGDKDADVKGTTSTPWSVIDWNVLWTVSAPQIEAGTYRPPPQQLATDELWESFEGLEVVVD